MPSLRIKLKILRELSSALTQLKPSQESSRLNMTPVGYDDYMVGAPVKGKYTLIFDQDGEVKPSTEKTRMFTAQKGECDKLPYRISYPLPGYGCAVFRFNEK